MTANTRVPVLARPCIGCSAPVRCKGRFVICAACWRIAGVAFEQAHPYTDPTTWQRERNARMTDLDWLTSAIARERGAELVMGDGR